MGTEKRKSQRFSITQLVDISDNRETFYKASSINISESGLLCEVSNPINIYNKMYLMLNIPPSEDPVEIEGVVVRVQRKAKKFEVAIEFIDMDENDRKSLRKLLK